MSQPLGWGKSDAELMASLEELELLPKAMCYTGCMDGIYIYSGMIESGIPIVLKGVERLLWVISEIDVNGLKGIIDNLPDNVKEHLSILRHNLELPAKIIRDHSHSMSKMQWGTIYEDSPLMCKNNAILTGSILHLTGISMRCQEMNRQMTIFNCW